jgi:uncharacterized protein
MMTLRMDRLADQFQKRHDAVLSWLVDTPVIETADVVPEPPQSAVIQKPEFGAAKATAAFFLMLLGQSLAGLAVIVVATVIALMGGGDTNAPGFVERVIAEATAPLLITAGVVSTLIVFAVVRVWAWHLVTDKSSTGIGLIPARASTVVICALAGAVFSMIYCAVTLWVIPFDPKTPLGPLATAAAAGGVNRLAWAFLALVFAPLFEEFFFRGLLLRGFSSSWGPAAGAVIVTVLFVVLHLFESIGYWPAIASICLLSIGTLVARTVSGSLVPAVALHAAYNFVIVVAVFAGPGLSA